MAMTVSRLKFVGLLFENLSGYTVVGEKTARIEPQSKIARLETEVFFLTRFF